MENELVNEAPAVEVLPGLPTIDKSKSKLEILNDIRKMIDKNGYSIDDDELMKVYNIMTDKTALKKLTFKLDGMAVDNANRIHEIKVFPLKKVYIEKYQEYIDFNETMFDEMIKNFSNPRLFKPYMDSDHELKEKYADIMDLYKKEDGLYAKIELTPRGVEAIKNRDYSYISPEFGTRVDTDKTKHNNVIWAVTLTNIPALEGENPTLQDQIQLNKTLRKGEKMERLKSLMKQLNKEDQVKSLAAPGEVDYQALVEEITPVLDELVMKIKEATAMVDQANQDKEVVVEEMEKVQAELEQVKEATLSKEADLFIEKNVKLGKILNVDEDYIDFLKDQYKKDSKSIIEKYELKQAIDNIKLTSSNTIKSSGLTDEDRAIMLDRGLDADDSKDVSLYLKAIAD